mmetsp:Transcript_84725/g.244930  ORF Transcript_84725/g.244930 Transcript_84725/m.244930 type:complete len:260 (+) Transcript_84725:216-995(+)
MEQVVVHQHATACWNCQREGLDQMTVVRSDKAFFRLSQFLGPLLRRTVHKHADAPILRHENVLAGIEALRVQSPVLRSCKNMRRANVDGRLLRVVKNHAPPRPVAADSSETPVRILVPHLVPHRADVQVPVPVQQGMLAQDRAHSLLHGRRVQNLVQHRDFIQDGVTDVCRRMRALRTDLRRAVVDCLIHGRRHTGLHDEEPASKEMLDILLRQPHDAMTVACTLSHCHDHRRQEAKAMSVASKMRYSAMRFTRFLTKP